MVQRCAERPGVPETGLRLSQSIGHTRSTADLALQMLRVLRVFEFVQVGGVKEGEAGLEREARPSGVQQPHQRQHIRVQDDDVVHVDEETESVGFIHHR